MFSIPTLPSQPPPCIFNPHHVFSTPITCSQPPLCMFDPYCAFSTPSTHSPPHHACHPFCNPRACICMFPGLLLFFCFVSFFAPPGHAYVCFWGCFLNLFFHHLLFQPSPQSTKYMMGKAATAKMGPNDAGCVIWALSNFFFLHVSLILLTNVLLDI